MVKLEIQVSNTGVPFRVWLPPYDMSKAWILRQLQIIAPILYTIFYIYVYVCIYIYILYTIFLDAILLLQRHAQALVTTPLPLRLRWQHSICQ